MDSFIDCELDSKTKGRKAQQAQYHQAITWSRTSNSNRNSMVPGTDSTYAKHDPTGRKLEADEKTTGSLNEKE